MILLSIETSCDDTAISVLKCKGGIKNASFRVLANASNSQIKIHAKYGGVFPSLAKREHIENLPILLEEVLKKAGFGDQVAKHAWRPGHQINLIAVTYGPGLEPSLWAGITLAKELGEKWKIPIMPVNHMEGHILSVFGKDKGKFALKKIKTPALSLLVSGGHTELVLSKKWMQYEVIGKTLDDAAGEAYDKVARMLGLEYPGGPKISKLAEIYRKNKTLHEGNIAQRDGASIAIRQQANMRVESGQCFAFSFPRPMIHSKNLDFSFSGLKTAVLYAIKKIGKLDENKKREIALEFENAVIETLVYKTKKALESHKAKTLIIGGGVASNTHLRREMKKLKNKNLSVYFPKKDLSGDNSIMIGIAGYLRFLKNKKKGTAPESIKATGNLSFK